MRLEDIFTTRHKEVESHIRNVFERLPFQLAELWVFPPKQDRLTCRFCIVKKADGEVLHWGLGHKDEKLNDMSRAKDSLWALLSGNSGNIVEHISDVSDHNQLGFSVYADWLKSLDNNFTLLNNAYPRIFVVDKTRNIYRLRDLWVVKLSNPDGNTVAILRLFNHISHTGHPINSQQIVMSQILQVLFRLSLETFVSLQINNEIEELGTVKRSNGNLIRIRSANAQMKEIFWQIRRVVEKDTIVLLQGDTGVGKNIYAEFIHQACSERTGKPFIVFSCDIPEHLLESELFGSKKGSFTNSIKDITGQFKVAEGGTLVIDEIHHLPIYLQVKLLRVIQEREYRPVGADRAEPLKARIIAATNKSLTKEVRENRFAKDLFYRINDYPIYIPSIQSRKEDIPLILEDLLVLPNMPGNLSGEVIGELTQRNWTGNIREIEYFLRRLRLVAKDHNNITLNDLDVADRMDDPMMDNSIISRPLYDFDWGKLLKWAESVTTSEEVSLLDLIQAVILQNTFIQKGRNKSAAAKYLGLSINTLSKYLDIYDKYLKVDS